MNYEMSTASQYFIDSTKILYFHFPFRLPYSAESKLNATQDSAEPSKALGTSDS